MKEQGLLFRTSMNAEVTAENDKTIKWKERTNYLSLKMDGTLALTQRAGELASHLVYTKQSWQNRNEPKKLGFSHQHSPLQELRRTKNFTPMSVYPMAFSVEDII